MVSLKRHPWASVDASMPVFKPPRRRTAAFGARNTRLETRWGLVSLCWSFLWREFVVSNYLLNLTWFKNMFLIILSLYKSSSLENTNLSSRDFIQFNINKKNSESCEIYRRNFQQYLMERQHGFVSVGCLSEASIHGTSHTSPVNVVGSLHTHWYG